MYIRMLHRCCMSAACCMDVASYMNAAWMLHGCGMVAWTLHGARCVNVAYTTYSHGVEIVCVCVCACVCVRVHMCNLVTLLKSPTLSGLRRKPMAPAVRTQSLCRLVTVNQAQTACSHCTVTVQSLYSQCTLTVQSVHSDCTVGAQSVHSHCTINAQ